MRQRNGTRVPRADRSGPVMPHLTTNIGLADHTRMKSAAPQALIVDP
jgi:hypothetical protein